jgi:hypothetical protein
MRRARAKIGHVALLTEPVPEAGSGERLAELSDEKRHLPGCALGDNRLEMRVHRDGKLGAGFLLANVQQAVADVLATHAHHVRAPLPASLSSFVPVPDVLPSGANAALLNRSPRF